MVSPHGRNTIAKYKIKYQENNKLKSKMIEANSKDELNASEELPQNIISITRQFSFDWNIELFTDNKKLTLEMFTQLNIMLNSNLTLSQSIELMLNHQHNSTVKDILLIIEDAIKKGKHIDIVLKKYEKFIGKTAILFLKLGIKNGNIKESIKYLVDILEQEYTVKQKIMETMRYPIILVISLFISISMIFNFVLPNFEYIFQMLEGNIPTPTKVMLWLKYTVSNHYLIILSFFVLLNISTMMIYRKYRINFEKFILQNIPLFSKLLKSYLFFRLFLAISIIVKSKYRFQTAIEHSVDIVDNLYINQQMKNILQDIKNGKSIASAFEHTELFDDITIKLIYTAQHSNSYETVLSDIAIMYDSRFNQSIKNFISFIEPATVLIISLVVLWLVLAVMLPIWDLSSII